VASLPSVFRRKIDLSSQEREPAPFIVGVTRSGTTLLRLMLDSHPELTIPPETHFIPKVIRHASRDNPNLRKVFKSFTKNRRWDDFEMDADQLRRRLARLDPLDSTSAVRCFYDLYAKEKGKPRWGDKTPGYQVRMMRISKALPEARFIHVIRDGRDVVLSQWSKSERPTPVEEAAKRWQQRVKRARQLSTKIPDKYIEVRYETLVDDPEAQLRRVCEFVSLDFDPVMLRHHEGAEERLGEIAKALPAKGGARELDAETRMEAHEMAAQPLSDERVEAWRNEMDPADLATFEEVAGEMLEELGYPLSDS
jgi:Sulfotransferase family